MRRNKEQSLALNISAYLQRQYPKVIFRYDVGADLKLTMNQAVKNKKLQGGLTGYPDLFLAFPNKGYHGLYVELKKDYAEVFKKDGSFKKSEHIENQHIVHERLRELGYCVHWGLGFEDTKIKIDRYLKGD